MTAVDASWRSSTWVREQLDRSKLKNKPRQMLEEKKKKTSTPVNVSESVIQIEKRTQHKD